MYGSTLWALPLFLWQSRIVSFLPFAPLNFLSLPALISWPCYCPEKHLEDRVCETALPFSYIFSLKLNLCEVPQNTLLGQK